MTLPRIAITTGDPAGVGPEIALRTTADARVLEICQPLLFGDRGLLERVARHLHLPVPEATIPVDQLTTRDIGVRSAVVDFHLLDENRVQPGQVSRETGKASYEYFVRAIAMTQAQTVDAIVTGPIHKEAIHAAGYPYPGHTEILADRTGTDEFCMMLTSDEISCSFVTTHIGLVDVPGLVTRDRVLETIRLTDQALRRMRGRPVKLVCCGLNPHAGEGGLFGNREEENAILPAVEQARQKGIQIEGPLPADTAFIASKRKTTDGYVCMYHDQGSIPLKAFAFDKAVNVTLGLPLVRTSVDHGTACDIAWQGIADHRSMIEAVRLAVLLCKD